MWGNGSIKKSIPAHKGVIHCIKFVKDLSSGKGIVVSGATDLIVKLTESETLTEIS